jgi:putative glycosyltransferase (TIGR04372 family)
MRKNFIEKIIIFFQIILVSPLILLIILLYPLIKIKFFELETRAIGHFSRSIEIFLSEIKLNIHPIKKTIYICFPNKFISNAYLLKKWKEHFLVFPRILIEPIFLFFRKIPFGSYFLAPYRHWTNCNSWKKPWQGIDIHSVLPKSEPNIKFSIKEIEEGNNYLRKHGLSIASNFICLIFRNSYYYYNKKIIPSVRFSLRDSNLNSLSKAAEYLEKKKYKIFNLGESNYFDKKIKHVIYYNNSREKNDFLDIFLPFHAKFTLSTATGLDSITDLSRKKRFLLNFSQINQIWSIDMTNDLFIPKKFKSLSTGKFIPYSDVLKFNLSNYHYLDDLNKDGYDCVSNSEEEIFSAIEEMEFFYNKKKYLSNEMDYLNKKFREIYYHSTGYKINRVKICDSFLRMNKDLIN